MFKIAIKIHSKQAIIKEALFESNDENATNRFKEEIHNLRYLTAMVIEHIQNWKNYLLAIN